jgi:sugar phosphate isomerase/epimerase
VVYTSRIIVPTSVFGQPKVDADCLDAYAALIAASGGQGMEIRRELFPPGEPPLDPCRRTLEQYRLHGVYSAPIELWLPSGELNEAGLAIALREARAIQADMVKMPLGHYDRFRSDVSALSRVLERDRRAGEAITLTVENDQTDYGGRLEPLQAFFGAVAQAALPVSMTFDIGNWSYCGENARTAAERLRDHVVYIHCKHVEQHGARMQTLPIPREPGAGWRELLRLLPSDALRAIEFPLPDASLLPEYIALLKGA